MSYRSVAAWVALVVLTIGCGFAVYACTAGAQQPSVDTQEVSVTRVVDGDTIEVSPTVDGTEDVRLIGVNTPETVDPNEPVEPCGPEASAFTTQQLEGQSMTLEFDEDRMDDLDRALAYVWVPDLDGELFNETLVREGYSEVLIIEPNDKYEDRLRAAEQQAKAEEVGIWSANPCEDQPPEVTTPEATTPEQTTPEVTTPERTFSPPP